MTLLAVSLVSLILIVVAIYILRSTFFGIPFRPVCPLWGKNDYSQGQAKPASDNYQDQTYSTSYHQQGTLQYNQKPDTTPRSIEKIR